MTQHQLNWKQIKEGPSSRLMLKDCDFALVVCCDNERVHCGSQGWRTWALKVTMVEENAYLKIKTRERRISRGASWLLASTGHFLTGQPIIKSLRITNGLIKNWQWILYWFSYRIFTNREPINRIKNIQNQIEPTNKQSYFQVLTKESRNGALIQFGDMSPNVINLYKNSWNMHLVYIYIL